MVTDHLGYDGGIIHGASRYYEQVLPRLDPARVRVRLCILGRRHPFASRLEQVEVEPIFLERAKWDPRSLNDLLRLVRELRPHVLHCLAMKGCLLGRVVGLATATPAIIHLHDTNEPGTLIGFLQRRLAPWTARALAASEVVHQYTVGRLGLPAGRVETLYNGLDVGAYANPAAGARQRMREALGFDDEAFVIIVAGRVVRSKGQHLLISLMPRLLAAEPRVRLLVAGDGADLARCRDLASSLGVADRVHFVGQRTDMAELLAASDVATMPSLEEEGFGYTALEAAAAGRAVVAFAAGAMHQIIADGLSGRVLRRGDADAMAETLIRLAGNPSVARRMGRVAMARACNFGIERHVGRLEALYSELARGGG